MPRWLSRVGVLGAIYVAVMGAAALWLPHEWDWSAFSWLSGRTTPAFSDEVSLVDVQWDPANVAADRRRLAAFLNRLVAANQQPLAVILDVEFDPCQAQPCGEPMQAAREALVASIRAAAQHFNVYALEQLPVDRNDDPSGKVDRRDAQIYAALSGSGHSIFTAVPQSAGLFYRDCYADVPLTDDRGAVLGTQTVWAMVDRVLMQPGFVRVARCDESHLPVRLGPPLQRAAPFVFASTEARPYPAGAQFDKKYLIVGTLQYDRSAFSDRSGPEILGWALSNALDRAAPVAVQTYYETHPPNGLLLLLVPAFSALAVLAYAAAFLALRRVRLGRLRHAVPWLAAGIASAVALTAFAAFEWWLLESRQIQPQISLVALGIVVAASLCALRAHQVMLDERNAVDLAPAEALDYDVFVSYAHEEGAWVAENVYRPLASATLPGGKKLAIFFDTSSLRTGTGWQDSISQAIDGSRFVVPVYSETYFSKPYCRFEIKRAHRKWIALGEGSRSVLPIMRGHPKIYATVDDIQAISLDDQPDLIARVVAEIVERLSQPQTAVAGRAKEGA